MDEQVLFQSADATITTARAVFGSTIYPVRGITAVNTQTIAAPVVVPVGLVLAGVFFGVLSIPMFQSTESATALGGIASLGAGAGLVLLGVALLKGLRPNYTVVIHTAGAQANALVSHDQDQVTRLVAALNDAIVRQAR